MYRSLEGSERDSGLGEEEFGVDLEHFETGEGDEEGGREEEDKLLGVRRSREREKRRVS